MAAAEGRSKAVNFGMKVAALYDIHGNLPALKAVLADVETERVDLIVMGGDVVPGPILLETIATLQALTIPVRRVRGNGDREVVAMFDTGVPSNEVPDGPPRVLLEWVVSQLSGAERDYLADFEPTVSIAGLAIGDALFCHGSPRGDTEIITMVTPDSRLEPMLADVSEPVIVCGHTHRQFDREFGGKRLLNAGSLGMPYEGVAAAFWLLIDHEAELRRSSYDIAASLKTFRDAGCPDVEAHFKESLIEPADPEMISAFFERRASK